MEDNFPKAYKEVIEVLNHFPKKDICKIPQELLDMFKKKMDNTYEFHVDVNKTLKEQHLLEETKDIFANLYRDYLATGEEKEKIKEKEKIDKEQLEEEKREKYPIDIFKEKG